MVRSGVDAGDLVVLSPMEKSRIAMTLKVLDVNNPETVLVDPPKPDWMKKKEAAEAKVAETSENDDKKKDKRWGKKKKDPVKKKAPPSNSEAELTKKSDQ